MQDPTRRKEATLDDLRALPEGVVGQLIEGVLSAMTRSSAC